jgi:hypothetical protein
MKTLIIINIDLAELSYFRKYDYEYWSGYFNYCDFNDITFNIKNTTITLTWNTVRGLSRICDFFEYFLKGVDFEKNNIYTTLYKLNKDTITWNYKTSEFY